MLVSDYVFVLFECLNAADVFEGFLHPIIHFGFGIEFNQPAIVAESLAEAAVHDTWTTDFLIKAEEYHKSHKEIPQKSLSALLDDIRADLKLSTAAEWDDANKVRDGILKRAPDEMIKYLSQWTVTEENLEEKTAEMTNNAIWFTAAAQRPPKQVRICNHVDREVNADLMYTGEIRFLLYA